MARRWRSPSRFFTCFRVGNSSIEPDRCGEQVHGRRGEEMEVRERPKSLTSGTRKVSMDAGEVDGGAKLRRKERPHRSFCRIVKVLLESSSAKKIHRRKASTNLTASKHEKLLANIEHAPHSASHLPANNLKTNNKGSSHCSPLNCSSYTSSSTPSCSSSGSSIISTGSSRQNQQFVHKKMKETQSGKMIINHTVNLGLCLFLVSILILMCWGKLWAIFSTLTLFMLVASRTNRVDSTGHYQLTRGNWIWRSMKRESFKKDC